MQEVDVGGCLRCRADITGHQSVEDIVNSTHIAVPDDGALSICSVCGYLSVYTVVDGKLRLRELTVEERDDIDANHPQVLKAVMAVHLTNAHLRRKRQADAN